MLPSSETLVALLIPLAIMLARIVDVSIGTLRIIFVSRGMKILAPLCGFFEVLIWLLAIGQIIHNLTSWTHYLAYATGFAIGNYIGMIIEERLAMGMLAVRIITQKEASPLIQALRDHNIGNTSLDAQGVTGKVALIFIIIPRNLLEKVENLVRKFNPNAFVSVSDIRSVREGYFPPHPARRSPFRRLLNTSLKRK